MTVNSASRVLLAIATAGRGKQMPLTMARLATLDPQPAQVIVVPASPEDFAMEAADLPFTVTVIPSRKKGLTAQRNVVLDALANGEVSPADILLFIDDDFYPCRDYIGALVDAFAKNPAAVAFSGLPIVDGATGPGVTHDEALLALERPDAQQPVEQTEPTYGAYGCNMSFRVEAIQKSGARFDESLPLYGWLEDVDFSRQVSAQGAILRSSTLRGVHLGTKAGRVSGRRLGYSQIANPAYCVRKGTLSRRFAAKQILRNVLKNFARVLAPEAWVDRPGRVSGNLRALVDWARGEMHPLKVTRM